MLSNYVYKDKDENLFIYYFHENKIIRKSIYNDEKPYTETVISSVKRNFTINVCEKGEIYIFCQNLKGDILLITLQNEEFVSQVILENKEDEKGLIVYFYSIIEDGYLTLIFNTPKGEEVSYLYMQKMKDNIWQKATLIDSFAPLKNEYFSFYKNKDDYYLIYQNMTQNRKIGIRNIDKDGFKDYFPYHTTNYQIIDNSVLFVEDSFFAVYTVKSAFSTQLIFRKNNQSGFTDTIILSEGQKIDNVLIFYSDKIYVFFTSVAGLYVVTSDDFGESFSKPQKYKRYTDENIEKAKYISYHNSKMCINDVFVSKNEPKTIAVIPDIYDDFYSDIIRQKEKKEVKQEIQNEVNDELNEYLQENVSVNMNDEQSHIKQTNTYKNAVDMTNEDFYKIFLQKQKEKEFLKKSNEVDDEFSEEELLKLKKENEKLKKALAKMHF